MLVGWSYGAFVICDYVRAYGQDAIAAIEFVEGAVKLGEAAFGTLIGPGFLDHFADATADDLPTNICGHARASSRPCLAKPLPAEDVETALCWNVVVPARVRANLAARELDYDDVLRALDGAAAGHPGPRGHRRAAGDGRARPRDLPDGGGVLVRRRRPRAAPGGAGALQPRARRARPPRARSSVGSANQAVSGRRLSTSARRRPSADHRAVAVHDLERVTGRGGLDAKARQPVEPADHRTRNVAADRRSSRYGAPGRGSTAPPR